MIRGEVIARAEALVRRPREQFLEGERLGDVVVGPRPQRLHLGVHGVLGRQHEHRRLHPAMAQRPQHLLPAPPRQAEIEDQQVVGLGARERLPRLPITDEVHRPTLLLEPALDELADRRVVLDDQDLHASTTGSVTVNVLPRPSTLSTVSCPPCSCTIA